MKTGGCLNFIQHTFQVQSPKDLYMNNPEQTKSSAGRNDPPIPPELRSSSTPCGVGGWCGRLCPALRFAYTGVFMFASFRRLIIQPVAKFKQPLTYRIYFLLMTVMFCWSCKKDVPEDVGADTLILGKWEFVRNSYISAGEIFVEKHIPGGYVEFLPEGRFAWYDYQTKIYTLFEVRYFLINQYWMYDDWILQNTNQAEYSHQKTAIGNPFGLPSLYNNIISFENKNTMMLHNHEKSIPYYIYSRIK